MARAVTGKYHGQYSSSPNLRTRNILANTSPHLRGLRPRSGRMQAMSSINAEYGFKLSQVCTGLVELFMTRPFHDTQEHMCVPWRRVAGPWR